MNKWHRRFLVAIACLAFPSPVSAQSCDPCCCTSLGGFYLGINGGILSYTWAGTELDPYFLTFEHASYKANDLAGTFGAQIGYDWLCCNRLFGVVADWNWTNAAPKLRQFLAGIPTVVPDQSKRVERSLHWFSTIRARAGLNFCDFLLYITGGAAVIDCKELIVFQGTQQGFFFPISESHSENLRRWGWTAGLGTEYSLGCGWTLGAEVLYLRFDSKRFTFVSPTFEGTFNFDFHDDLWLGRLALNYHFSLCSLW